MSLKLIQSAGFQLHELMDQTSIASVQACTLLGSYYVYHGKPNLSFALLGATIKTAQAIGLHRQSLSTDDSDMVEERKRIWWTIYTWDRYIPHTVGYYTIALNKLTRFASITYGRPIGINDKDCNVTQPLDVLEHPRFTTDQSQSDEACICYSSYQRELNQLYLAASPIIEMIYGMRAAGLNESYGEQQHITRIRSFTDRLWVWRSHLPAHLELDLSSDCEANQSGAARIHKLQALALQLTFDNLLIIFHRPVLVQQVDHIIRSQPEQGSLSTHSPTVSLGAPSSSFLSSHADSPSSPVHVTSTEQWWNAALRTSKVTERPLLAQMATDSHLIAFMAINLFNSAIVMAVLALSDPLADRAQEIKRVITRTYRLLELLGKKTQLSMQSNIVLKDVIQMLLRREADAMLAPIIMPGTAIRSDRESAVVHSEEQFISVEDTLRLPMHLPLGTMASNCNQREPGTADQALRLNESLAAVQKGMILARCKPRSQHSR